MSKQPDRHRCSIIIRAFNEEQHIGKLLSGIMQQSVDNHEIILVDSGSTDATAAIATRFPVRVISIQPEEFTFGRALNVGCAAAGGEYLVFASAHVYPVYPDWLQHLLSLFADPQVALVYGKQRGDAGSRFSEQQVFEKLYPERSTRQQTSPICNNANAAIRRSLWSERPYDEHLPGLEDVDWANWALGQGYVLAYSAEAEVVHVHDESPRQVLNRYRREAIGLSRIRPEQRVGVLDFVKLYLSNVWSDVRSAVGEGRLPGVLWQVLWFRFMQFWGTYRGFAFGGPITDELIHAFYYPRGTPSGDIATPRRAEPIDYSGGRRIKER